MTTQDEPDLLLVVVGSQGQAGVIQAALSVRGIATQVRRDVAKVVEFGSELGPNPFGVYVRGEDLTRAKDVLVEKGLPGKGAAPDFRSAFGM